MYAKLSGAAAASIVTLVVVVAPAQEITRATMRASHIGRAPELPRTSHKLQRSMARRAIRTWQSRVPISDF